MLCFGMRALAVWRMGRGKLPQTGLIQNVVDAQSHIIGPFSDLKICGSLDHQNFDILRSRFAVFVSERTAEISER